VSPAHIHGSLGRKKKKEKKNKKTSSLSCKEKKKNKRIPRFRLRGSIVDVIFACLNVRSLNNEFQDVIRDRRVDIFASSNHGMTQTVPTLAVCDRLVLIMS